MREGKLERAIREHFAAHPEEAFTTDELCAVCYPGLRSVGYAGDPMLLARKHRVAVLRAAEKVLASDPDWKSAPTHGRGNMRFFWNAASVPGTAMGFIMSLGQNCHRDWLVRRTREELAHPDGRKRCESKVADHIAVRDAADPAERERLKAKQEAASAAALAGIGIRIKAAINKPQVLPSPPRAGSDNTKALASKARALIMQNDPDAVRAGLAEIADALDSLGTLP